MSGQQAGNLRTSSKTLNEDWKASGSLGTLGKCRELLETCILRDFLHVFVTKSVKFGRTEVSIAPIDAKFQDLSFGKGPGA